ncbi:hypothetical protein AB0K18_27875 [Nonomuraea sp. NPDC049421]|uniref:hypothetical protein n=1 Tax=Nonomuraea sp. NPDC049421 TaxID=3155275 RepID=UPI00342F55FC
MINDEYFLAALRLGAGNDPIPGHVSAAARDAYRLRVPMAVTAAAHAESATIRSVREDDSSHLVRFIAAGLTFDLEVTEGDGLIDVAGHISPYPGEGALVDVRSPHLTLTRRIAPTGHFVATGLPPGWLSVVCHRPGHAPVQTTWVRIRP